MREQLLKGNLAIGIWGLGFIGYSSMANLAARGVRCSGTDVDKVKVDCVCDGRMPVQNIEYWLGFDTKPLCLSGMMQATTDWTRLISTDVTVHLICVPTEKNDAPYFDILKDVATKLSGYRNVKTASPPLVIIESTLTPNATDKIVIPIFEANGLKVGQDILLGVAPRRDWFVSSEKNLRTLPRVVGGTTKETTALMRSVLGIVCDTVLSAKDHRHAELVKGIENAYRHVEITLANQLSLAYPDIDMREVLALVGTKWNIGTYQPSFGTGGYCIPLASQYILSGAKDNTKLSILHATVETDKKLPYMVADAVMFTLPKKVGVLGLAYKGDLKVHILSPTLKIVERLKTYYDRGDHYLTKAEAEGVTVKVNDPYYDADEIKRICGVDTFDFPNGLKEFDTVLVVADHRQYQAVTQSQVLDNLTNCKLVIDNTGIWREIDFASKGIEYRLAGTANWL